MESTERLISVLFSAWYNEGGFFKRGRECILCLTNKRIALISKTNMKFDTWQKEMIEQVKYFRKSNNPIRLTKSYTLQDLERDLPLDSKLNTNIPLKQVTSMKSESKRWGNELTLEFNDGNTTKTYKIALVKSWLRYPIKDPLEYESPDWDSWISAAKSYT